MLNDKIRDLSKAELLDLLDKYDNHVAGYKEAEETIPRVGEFLEVDYPLIGKRTYRVPVEWKMFGWVEVVARDTAEAIEIATGPDTPLPDRSDYADGSCVVAPDTLDMIEDLGEVED